jgi:hypothetical protein
MYLKSACVIACAFAGLAQALSAQTPQPHAVPAEEGDQAISEDRLASPDGRFSVAIVHKPHPRGDELEQFTLELRSGAKVIANYPTTGYLLAVHWSPNVRLVAINNRRANSGDYLWVLSLKDGAAVKRPEDRFDESVRIHVERAVRKRDRRATTENLRKYWLTAKGWRDAGVLDIQFCIAYWENIGTFRYDARASVGRQLQLGPGTLSRLTD